jgi:hypothetical protein
MTKLRKFTLALLIGLSLAACKKKPTPAPDYFMTLEVNGKSLTYTDCAESETIINGQPETIISGYYSTALDQTDKMFEIFLIADENNLKTGQVYQCQGIDSKNYEDGTNVFFNYYAGGVEKFEVASPQYSPVGTVTLTEVTPDYIKGTFSGVIGGDGGSSLRDTITNGVFYSSHHSHTGVIQF